MSNLQRFENIREIVKMTESQFAKIASIHNAVTFIEESYFALQALQDNEYLAGVAMGNQDSLKRAIINVASVGLSLNPYKKQAYLVPRKVRGTMQVCLDISYVGYVQLAVDCGILKKADVELVYSNDDFEFRGHNLYPHHNFEMFNPEARGTFVGGYVVAVLSNAELVFTHMASSEINAIRDRSEGWKAHVNKGSHTIWNSDFSEMAKKTLIRRARKSWPMPRGSGQDRMSHADGVLNESEPVILNQIAEPDDAEKVDLLLKIRSALEILERSEESYVKYISRINRRDLKRLEDMTKVEMKQSIVALSQLVDQKNAKESK
jgi:phage RecT family recombinase